MTVKTGSLLQKIVPHIRLRVYGRTARTHYKKCGVLLVMGAVAFNATENKEKKYFFDNVGATTRFLRSLRIGMLISFDYYFSMWGLTEADPTYAEDMSQIHQRAADRILAGCLRNGGLYIKLGQGLVALNHILPREYLDTLQILHDQCLNRKKDEVTDLFMEDFGKPPSEIFETFNPEPLAAGSLAQVYKAKTKDGEEVAVKVQYSDLQQRFYSDVATIKFLLKIIAYMHPSFNFSWVLDDLSDTLKQELDFVNEGKNSERCAADLEKLTYVYVPKVHWDKTSLRVLTTEYIDGIKINDVNTLNKLHYSLSEINYKLFCTFGEQIFHTGFVHADPHPGNVFIRKDKNNKVQIVLLDHGLYEELPEAARTNLCNFWNAIVFNDTRNMQKYSRSLGVEDYEIFAEILTQRPLKTGLSLSQKLSDTDLKYMTQMAQDRFDKIMKTLRSMPKSMILVIRNLNTVRSIARCHGDPTNRFTTFARIACRNSPNSKATVFKSLSIVTQRVSFEFKLWYSNLKIFILKFILNVLHILGKAPNLAEQIA